MANKLGCSQSTVSRYLSLLANKHNIKWHSQVNWSKLGLQPHLLYIQFHAKKDKLLANLYSSLQTNRYSSFVSIGKINNFSYIFCILTCPYIVAVLVNRRLERYLRTGHIVFFEILPVTKEEYYQGIVLDEFQPTNQSIQLLLNNEFSVKRIKTFCNEKLNNKSLYKFTNKDSMLLQFLSINHSVSLTKKSANDFWIADLTTCLQDKEINLNNYLELIPLLNKLQNYALKESLIDY